MTVVVSQHYVDARDIFFEGLEVEEFEGRDGTLKVFDHDTLFDIDFLKDIPAEIPVGDKLPKIIANLLNGFLHVAKKRELTVDIQDFRLDESFNAFFNFRSL